MKGFVFVPWLQGQDIYLGKFPHDSKENPYQIKEPVHDEEINLIVLGLTPAYDSIKNDRSAKQSFEDLQSYFFYDIAVIPSDTTIIGVGLLEWG